MASPADIDPNLPETLPADFGEWDSSDAQAAPPAEIPQRKTPEKTPKESAQRESARREAEALDFATKPSVAREISRELEPSLDVTPFPERDEAPVAPRGIPAPVIRAPRLSAAPTPIAAPPAQDDSALTRRLNAVDMLVEKPPVPEVSTKRPVTAKVTLIERKPDTPLFSSDSAEESEMSDDSPTLLNDLMEDEEERKTRRRWIINGCVFGGVLVLVVFQLIHYGTAGKIKHIVNTPQITATNPETDSVPDTIADLNPVAAKPSPAKQSSESESEPVETVPEKAAAKAPAAVQTQMMQSQLMAPTRLPQSAKAVPPSDAPPSALGGASMAALNGNNSVGSVFGARSNTNVSGPKVITISAGVATGMLIRQTQPVYPPIAKSARVQGTVVLNAVISRTGKVANVQVVNGPPMLRQAALDAVKTWQYKPYTLNNEPTEINTTINVVFTLGG